MFVSLGSLLNANDRDGENEPPNNILYVVDLWKIF